jgi:DNA polymerase-3 subunit gamma/tau
LGLKAETAPQASVAAPAEAVPSQSALVHPGALGHPDPPAELTEAAEPEAEPFRKSATAPRITTAPSIETLRLAVISALVDGGHATAAQILGAGSWSVDGSSLRIEVAGIGKKMLSLTVNAAAEKIIRQELQRLSAPARFLVVPVEGSAPAAGATGAAAPVAPAGSIQETALANPLVQRAKEIFKAEVRSVIDLRAR